MSDETRLTPEIRELAKKYEEFFGFCEYFHLVLEDGNVEDEFVIDAISSAKAASCWHSVKFGEILLSLTVADRLEIGGFPRDYND